MSLNPKLQYKLSKKYPPSTRIDEVYHGKEISFITNEHGEPITLFIGKRREDGAITGERYVRKIVREPGSDKIRKSHWDNKGKVLRA
jgi:hypothetical protein